MLVRMMDCVNRERFSSSTGLSLSTNVISIARLEWCRILDNNTSFNREKDLSAAGIVRVVLPHSARASQCDNTDLVACGLCVTLFTSACVSYACPECLASCSFT